MVKKATPQFLREPVRHLDLKKAHSLLDLVQAFEHTSFQSRNLFKCYETFLRMVRDPRCIIFLGLSGAMIPGGMRRVIHDMIEMKLVDVIVSTGANIFHDIFENFGYSHYVGSEAQDDDLLRKHRVVRVYDALMDDREINQVIQLLSRVPEEVGERVISSREYLAVLGTCLKDEGSILRTASRFGVPIFVPALCDSSVGIGLTFLHARKKDPSDGPIIDQIRDNFEIAQVKKIGSVTGAIYVGGGVPKNYIQQLGPVSELLFKEGKRPSVRSSDHHGRPQMGRALRLHLRGGQILGKDRKGIGLCCGLCRCDDSPAPPRWRHPSGRESLSKEEEAPLFMAGRETEIDPVRLTAIGQPNQVRPPNRRSQYRLAHVTERTKTDISREAGLPVLYRRGYLLLKKKAVMIIV